MVYKPAKGRYGTEQTGIADKYHVLACAGHGHIQLAVDFRAVDIGKGMLGEEFKLILALDGESVYYIFALAPLETLHCVYGYVGQLGNACVCDKTADGGNLVTVGHYYS